MTFLVVEIVVGIALVINKEYVNLLSFDFKILGKFNSFSFSATTDFCLMRISAIAFRV